MTRACFAIPGEISTLSGGYGYDRALLSHLSGYGIDVEHVQLPEEFPFPSPADVAETFRLLGPAAPADVILIDGLAFGALPPDGLSQRLRSPLVALVHHPLGLEAGLSPEQSRALIHNERAALRHARHVIVTSQTTRDRLVADFGVAASDVTVAVPGSDRRCRAPGSLSDRVHLLAVGAVIARKAYEVLVAALAPLAHLPWQLTIVGSLEREPRLVASLRRHIAQAGLRERIVLAGEASGNALDQAFLSADVFVLSSLYEGYGMVLGEAMAHGLPIVTSTGGAAGSTVPDGAGIKVAPGDVAALTNALEAVVTDAGLRTRLADASWAAGQALPAWSDTARIVASILHRFGGRD